MMRIELFHRFIVISAVCLSGCSNADRFSEDSSPECIIQADNQTLEQAIEKAHAITLETGRPVAIRMRPRDNSEDVRRDQELARRAIEAKYGGSRLLTVEPINSPSRGGIN